MRSPVRALAPHIQSIIIHLEGGQCFYCMREQRMRSLVITFSRQWWFLLIMRSER